MIIPARIVDDIMQIDMSKLDPKVALYNVLRTRFVGQRVAWGELQDNLTSEIASYGTLRWNRKAAADLAAQSAQPPVSKQGFLYSSASPAEIADYIMRDLSTGYVADEAKVEVIIGPRRFLRFAGESYDASRARHYLNNPWGEWWFDEELFKSIDLQFADKLSNYGAQRKSLLQTMRQKLAVLKDWNDFSELYLLDVGGKESIVAIVGTVKPQRDRDLGDLPGGVAQYYFPIKNPFNVTRVDNPSDHSTGSAS